MLRYKHKNISIYLERGWHKMRKGRGGRGNRERNFEKEGL
jgi:hypothetical protein